MQIRFDGANGSIHTTLAELFDANRGVTRDDREIEALLLAMLARVVPSTPSAGYSASRMRS